MKRYVFCVFVVLLMGGAPGVANALTCGSECVFNYQFQFTDGTQTLNLSGQLTTSSIPDPSAPISATGYDIVGITGTSTIRDNSTSAVVYSSTLASLLPPQPNIFDNILYFPKTDAGYFDIQGVAFQDNANSDYNIFSGGALVILFGNLDNGAQAFDTVVSENVAPVPEPSTWALLLVGFMALGFAAHRGRARCLRLAC